MNFRLLFPFGYLTGTCGSYATYLVFQGSPLGWWLFLVSTLMILLAARFTHPENTPEKAEPEVFIIVPNPERHLYEDHPDVPPVRTLH